MDPAKPPLPTVRNFRFHCAGIHSSKRISGAMVPATRQNAGTSTDTLRAPAEGSVKDPAATDVAELTVRPAIVRLVRPSQGRWAKAETAHATNAVSAGNVKG